MNSLAILHTLLIAMGFNCMWTTDTLSCGHPTTHQWVIVDQVSKSGEVDILTSAMGYPKPVLRLKEHDTWMKTR